VLSGGRLSMAVALPPYPGAHLEHLVAGAVIAAAAAVIGMAAVSAFRWVHPLFHRLSNPLLMTAVGGVLLGVLGVVGGPVTLFKGLDQMKELAANAADYSAFGLLGIAVVKVAALVIAGTCGFRGGRIFPAVFVGVALGLAIAAGHADGSPALAVSCGLTGVLLAVTRQGWLSLFMALVVAPEVALIPVLTLVMLPAWLLVTGRPQMQIEPES
jgi:H+/Cl- antiporter ClcA